MKIIDCTSFYNEHLMYEIRLNILKDKIITWNDVEFNINDETISYRKKMETQIKD